jgi:hypothetical protein
VTSGGIFLSNCLDGVHFVFVFNLTIPPAQHILLLQLSAFTGAFADAPNIPNNYYGGNERRELQSPNKRLDISFHNIPSQNYWC